ncbi:MAG: hypothetical protein V1750_05700, partial [Acidobacteriota bacterium]
TAMQDQNRITLADVEEALVFIEAWVDAVRKCVKALAEEYPEAAVNVAINLAPPQGVDYGGPRSPVACAQPVTQDMS